MKRPVLQLFKAVLLCSTLHVVILVELMRKNTALMLPWKAAAVQEGQAATWTELHLL